MKGVKDICKDIVVMTMEMKIKRGSKDIRKWCRVRSF